MTPLPETDEILVHRLLAVSIRQDGGETTVLMRKGLEVTQRRDLDEMRRSLIHCHAH